MKVYRLEHDETRQGPWHNIGDLPPEAAYNLGKASKNPSPGEEGLDVDDPVIRTCGCSSWAQLRDWFELVLWLEHTEYVVRVYEVPSELCRLSAFQVLFSFHHAELSSEHRHVEDLCSLVMV